MRPNVEHTVPADHEHQRTVTIVAGDVELEGDLTVPDRGLGCVLFAHGSGSSRHSPRSRAVAEHLNQAGLATLLLDLLTPQEEQADSVTREHRFDIGMLAGRLVAASEWLAHKPETSELRTGYFGASTGAGAALLAAVNRPDLVSAVVSRGGRPDLAGSALKHVQAPTMLIVGSADVPVLDLNREALEQMDGAETRLELIPGATHRFEEPGALERVAELAADWFLRYLNPLGSTR